MAKKTEEKAKKNVKPAVPLDVQQSIKPPVKAEQ
jgi:hypothetical protein